MFRKFGKFRIGFSTFRKFRTFRKIWGTPKVVLPPHFPLFRTAQERFGEFKKFGKFGTFRKFRIMGVSNTQTRWDNMKRHT